MVEFKRPSELSKEDKDAIEQANLKALFEQKNTKLVFNNHYELHYSVGNIHLSSYQNQLKQNGFKELSFEDINSQETLKDEPTFYINKGDKNLPTKIEFNETAIKKLHELNLIEIPGIEIITDKQKSQEVAASTVKSEHPDAQVTDLMYIKNITKAGLEINYTTR